MQDAECERLRSENERLRAELGNLRKAVEHMHEGLCMLDPDRRVAVWNSRYAEILQLPPEAIRRGGTLLDLVEAGIKAGHYPAEKPAAQIAQELLSKVNRRSQSRATVVRHGVTYAMNYQGTEDGHWVATFEDISAQIKAEEALRASEARLSATIDAMPDCVKIFDETGRILHINPCGLQLAQAVDAESLSEPGYSVFAPEYLTRSAEIHGRVIAGESVVWGYELVGLAGRRRHVEAHSVPFRLPDGSAAHLCISRDIHERKKAEDALRRSEERLRLVQEVTGLADYETNADGLATCSELFFQQVGLPEGNKTIAFKQLLQLVHPEDRERFQKEVQRGLESDSFQCEFRIVRADNGETRWILSRSKLERDEQGSILRTIGAHLDITDRKRAEEALRES